MMERMSMKEEGENQGEGDGDDFSDDEPAHVRTPSHSSLSESVLL